MTKKHDTDCLHCEIKATIDSFVRKHRAPDETNLDVQRGILIALGKVTAETVNAMPYAARLLAFTESCAEVAADIFENAVGDTNPAEGESRH